MFYPIITFICLLAAWPLGDDTSAVWLLVLGQAVLLLRHVLRGQVTAVGAFMFMSFLFFGVRAIYILTEQDYRLFTNLFLIPASPEILTNAVWWGTAAMLFFHLGGEAAPALHRAYFSNRRRLARTRHRPPVANDTMVGLLIGYQVATLPVMLYIAGGGRALYGSPIGAYMYDIPMVLQAGHVFALVVILERWLRERDPVRMITLVISGILFLLVTWLMREVSIFRGFYITGVMVAGIAMLARMQRRVSMLWLMLPIVLLQPAFRTLGETRTMTNEEVSSMTIEDRLFGGETALDAYWKFYDSGGDINILDTFAAASVYEPKHYPYVLSWLYAPVHFLPRAIWKSKPEKGILQDMDFTHGAPYCPGIAGFFLLDGGFLWMLGCMAVLGYLLSFIDQFLLSMPRSYLRCCLLSIFVINAMFLTRSFLWHSLWQTMYATVPILLMHWLLNGKKNRMTSGSQIYAGKQRRSSNLQVNAAINESPY